MYANDENNNNRLVFVTGTRADYGKMKSLIRAVEQDGTFEPHVFATGMHMLAKYGATYQEIYKDKFAHIYTYINQNESTPMDIALSNTILGFANYVTETKPAGIVVHGDRLEALAGSIVGAFHNVKVFHIEGGEVSGTIDESIRHAITKFSHYHFVANENAKKRIMQLGEPEDNIIIFGSPDIDIMYSDTLPTMDEARNRYAISFANYNIFMYHPVTTESSLAVHIHDVVEALLRSDENYVVIYPNNDMGNDVILREYQRLDGNPHFRVFPSVRFEHFLTLLKNCDCVVGNSSSGIREASIYGKPVVDIGTRQQGRYDVGNSPHVLHVEENTESVLSAIGKAHDMELKPMSYFGLGNSNQIFLETLKNERIWNSEVQKRFVDVDF